MVRDTVIFQVQLKTEEKGDAKQMFASYFPFVDPFFPKSRIRPCGQENCAASVEGRHE